MNQTKHFFLILMAFITLSACQFNSNKAEAVDMNTNEKSSMHEIVVNEIVNTSSYTYLNVSENNKAYWIAIPKSNVEKGKTYYYVGGLEMKNFKSTELNKVFESVYFVQGIVDNPDNVMKASSPHGGSMSGNSSSSSTSSSSSPHGSKPVTANKKEISVEPVEDGVLLKDLFADMKSYSKKTVIIKGEVVKVNNGIMGMNWVHIQDGTSSNGNFDLLVTTLDIVNVGDVITFKGSIALNKDFGMGYKYDILLEEAKKQ